VLSEVKVASGIVESNEKESEQASPAPAPQANRSQLVQRLLNSSNDLPMFVNDLLTTQAVTVAGTEAAGFLLERGAENTVGMRLISHIRPDNSSPETRAAAVNAFQDLIRPCLAQNRDGAIEIGAPADGGEAQFCLVTLLRAEGDVVAVSAVVTRCMNTERARQRLMSMQLVAGYFELYTLRKNSDQSRLVAQSHQHVLQLATSVATAEGFESAAMNLCNELATRSGASRVSLGWLKGRNIKIKALSHTEEFDKKQELIVILQKVMEECVDQEDVVQFDPSGKGTDNVTRSAQELSRAQGGHTVLSLPLRRRAEIIGVVTLEFLSNHKITPQIAHGLSVAVDLLAPQLYDRYQNDRYLVTKAAISTRETAKLTIGPKHMIAKLIAIGVVALVLVVTLVKPMYHVTGSFQFTPITRLTLSAPFEGQLEKLAIVTADGQILPPENRPLKEGEHRLKPGDKVKAGTVLLKMRTVDLEMKRNEARADVQKYRHMAEQYRAEGKEDSLSKAEQADDQADEAQAQVDYLNLQIDEAYVKAPIDGVVLKGDLEDKQGSPVKQGDELFEIGNPSSLEAEVYVPERDIQDVQDGKHGELATKSLPNDKYDFMIRRVVPDGQPKDGENVFKVYGTIKDANASWRPGMEGEARIDVAPKPLWWIASHRVIDFLRLKFWTL
jgi:multidrug efflux pump subunit AcrA (membrane-fusion protein)